MGKLIAVLGLVGALVALASRQSPEVRRYMKIRSM
jgi:hypothetical protein